MSLDSYFFISYVFYMLHMGSTSRKAHARLKAKQKAKEIARERIRRYLVMAKGVFPDNPALANRYVTLARNTAMKYQVRIPSEYKRLFCKHCYRFLRPGVNASVRTSPRQGGHVVYFCKECNRHMRFPYVREKKSRGSRKILT